MKKEIRKGWEEQFIKAKENNKDVFNLTKEDREWLDADLAEEEIDFKEVNASLSMENHL